MSQKDDQPGVQNRRRTLRTLGVAGGAIVATKWSKPIVESVIIPAHAETTEKEEEEAPIVAGGGGASDSATATSVPT